MADINDRLERLNKRDELTRRVLAQRALPDSVAELGEDFVEVDRGGGRRGPPAAGRLGDGRAGRRPARLGRGPDQRGRRRRRDQRARRRPDGRLDRSRPASPAPPGAGRSAAAPTGCPAGAVSSAGAHRLLGRAHRRLAGPTAAQPPGPTGAPASATVGRPPGEPALPGARVPVLAGAGVPSGTVSVQPTDGLGRQGEPGSVTAAPSGRPDASSTVTSRTLDRALDHHAEEARRRVGGGAHRPAGCGWSRR